MRTLKLILDKNHKIVACCCGHGKHPMSIIVRDKYGNHFDTVSGTLINRKRRFYKKDDGGYYHIPETENSKTQLPIIS
jgi:hypothetical protein